MWIVACLKPNEAGLPVQADGKCLRAQVGALGLTEICSRLNGSWAVDLLHREFWDRYHQLPSLAASVEHAVNAVWADKLKIMASDKGWKERDMAVGKFKVSPLACSSKVRFFIFVAGILEPRGVPSIGRRTSVERRSGNTNC